MRWFTCEWHSGEFPDDRVDEISAEYWRHIEAIAPQLPEDLRRLAGELNLHDGLFRTLTVEAPARLISWTARCGDLQRGYRDIQVRHSDADLRSGTIDDLVKSVSNPETEILYSEVDQTDDDRYVHRLLLWPYAEIAVEFSAITVAVREMPDRQFGPNEPVVEVIS